MKRFLSIILCSACLCLFNSPVIARDAYGLIKSQATKDKITKILGGGFLGWLALASAASGDRGYQDDSSLYTADSLLLGVGIFIMLSESDAEKDAKRLSIFTDKADRENESYESLRKYALRADFVKSNRITYGLLFTLFTVPLLTIPSEPEYENANNVLKGICAITIYEMLFVKSFEEKCLDLYRNKVYSRAIIVPTMRPGYIGLAMSRRF
jgi:hypothetical protein